MLGRPGAAHSAAVPSSPFIRETRPWRAIRREGQVARPGRPQAAKRRAIVLHRQRKAGRRPFQAALSGNPRVCAGTHLGHLQGRFRARQVRRTMPTASSGAEASAAASPASGRPPPGPSPIGGAAQRPGGAAAGSPDGAPRGAAPRHAEAAPKTSRSWLGALAAGIVGGAIAALALSYWALSRDGGQVAALRAQVQGMEQALAGAEGRSGDVAQLTTRVDALESDSGAAVGERPQGPDRRRSRLPMRTCKSAWTRSSPGTAGPQVQDLATRVDQLEVCGCRCRRLGRARP